MTTIEHLKPELAGYEVRCESLEARYPGQVVAFPVAGSKGAHLSFHEPAKDASERFREARFPLSHPLGRLRSARFPYRSHFLTAPATLVADATFDNTRGLHDPDAILRHQQSPSDFLAPLSRYVHRAF